MSDGTFTETMLGVGSTAASLAEDLRQVIVGEYRESNVESLLEEAIRGVELDCVL